MELTKAQELYDASSKLFQKRMAEKGHPVKCTDGYRSYHEQAALYALGRTKPGRKVTNARAGQSPHNYGSKDSPLARDWCFVLPHGKVTWNGPWDLFGRVAKSCGLVWGGGWLKFRDRPHTESPYWRQFKR